MSQVTAHKSRKIYREIYHIIIFMSELKSRR